MEQRSLQEQHFISLFEQYRSPVFAYIQSVTGDAYVSEELTQELFIKLWDRKDHWQEIESMDGYIRRMAHNACMTWFRKLALDEKLIREVKSRMEIDSNNVEYHIAYKEAQKRIDEAVMTLSPQRRKAFELSRKQGLKLSEVAAAMGISFHTANHHLGAALDQIRAYLITHNGDKALLVFILLLMD
ncbi:MAG: sigma-70 family RNA polymerase sigma factor [Chitinophagaceae bacterium]|nr:sigma-70 family RNA polymerase sigma factor [Chitinophagaceae bacterium]